MKNPGVVAMIAESDLMAPRPGFFHTLQDYDKSAESEALEILDHFQDQFLAHLHALSVPLPTSGFPQGWPRGLKSRMARPSSSPARPTTWLPAHNPTSPYLRPEAARYPRPRAEKAWLRAPSDFRRGVMTTERRQRGCTWWLRTLGGAVG